MHPTSHPPIPSIFRTRTYFLVQSQNIMTDLYNITDLVALERERVRTSTQEEGLDIIVLDRFMSSY